MGDPCLNSPPPITARSPGTVIYHELAKVNKHQHWVTNTWLVFDSSCRQSAACLTLPNGYKQLPQFWSLQQQTNSHSWAISPCWFVAIPRLTICEPWGLETTKIIWQKLLVLTRFTNMHIVIRIIWCMYTIFLKNPKISQTQSQKQGHQSVESWETPLYGSHTRGAPPNDTSWCRFATKLQYHNW